MKPLPPPPRQRRQRPADNPNGREHSSVSNRAEVERNTQLNAESLVPTNDSTTITQPPSPPLKPPETRKPSSTDRSYVKRIIRSWWSEILAIALAVVFLGGILATTIVHSGQPLPKYGLSVNTVVSIFSACLKSAILFVCGEGLSHLKWRWFQHGSRSLRDLTVFDNASRGPAGASQLIWILRGKHWITFIGAVVTVLMLALDPFSQQIVTYYSCGIASSNNNNGAKVPKANYDWDQGLSEFPGDNIASLPMQAAANSGVFSSELAWRVPVACPSGNCTFDDFSTIGYCSVCSDVTSRLNVVDLGAIYFANDTGGNTTAHLYNITFPSGFGVPVNESLSYGNYYSPVFSMGSAAGKVDLLYNPYTYAIEQNLVPGAVPNNNCGSEYNLTSSTENTWLCPGYGAASCDLYPCIKKYSVAVHNGLSSEQLLATSANGEWRAYDPTTELQFAVDLDCLPAEQRSRAIAASPALKANQRYIYNLNYTKYPITQDPTVNTTCVYGYHTLAPTAYDAFFNTFFAGNATIDYRVAVSDKNVLVKIYNNNNVSMQSISQMFNNVTEAMTSYIRQNPSGQLYNANTGISTAPGPNSGPALGVVITSETCVRVGWGWVAFPAAMVVLAIVFLAGVIVHSTSRLKGDDGAMRSTHDWKSDPLLLLRATYNDLNFENEVEKTRVASTKIPAQSTELDLSAQSKKVRATLEFDEHNGRWVFMKSD